MAVRGSGPCQRAGKISSLMASNESDKSRNSQSTSQSAAVPRAVSRSVERAAKAGGGRTRAQNSTPWKYYGTLIGIAVVGLGLIGQSWVATREDPKAPYLQSTERAAKEFKLLSAAQEKYKKNPKAPALKAAEKRYADYTENSHIHAAYGIYDCTKAKGQEWLLPINGENDLDPKGIHAHADGLLHVHPFSKNVTGRRAIIGRWFEATGVKVNGSEIFLPAKDASTVAPTVIATKEQTLKAGAKCKNGKASVIHVFEYKSVLKKDGTIDKNVEGKRALGSAKDVPIKAGYAYVFARVDKDFTPPVPPAAEALAAPSDQVSATGDTPPAPAPVPVPSTKAGSSPVSTVKGAATSVAPSTVKGAASSVAPTSAATPTTAVAPTTKKK